MLLGWKKDPRGAVGAMKEWVGRKRAEKEDGNEGGGKDVGMLSENTGKKKMKREVVVGEIPPLGNDFTKGFTIYT